jgi:hypothetical protein
MAEYININRKSQDGEPRSQVMKMHDGWPRKVEVRQCNAARSLTLTKHSRGQWCCKRKGRFHYFGRDIQDARKRAAELLRLEIQDGRTSFTSACQKVMGWSLPSWEATYAAFWTLRFADSRIDINCDQSVRDEANSFLSLADGRYVYLITDYEGDLKIGYAKDVRNRVKDVQTSNKRPVQLAACLPGGKPHEGDLHRRFASLRIRGEWFHRTDHLESFVDEVQTLLNEWKKEVDRRNRTI